MADPFIGEIRIMAFSFPPRDWATCNGQLVSVQQHQALFMILHTTFGGDGHTTFGLPDLRGRAPVHVGMGPNLSNRTWGEKIGDEYITLTMDQMGAHTHNLTAQSANADKPAPSNKNSLAKAGYSHSGRFNLIDSYSNAPVNLVMSASIISQTGDGRAHFNMQPFIPLNFCIALSGIYPPPD